MWRLLARGGAYLDGVLAPGAGPSLDEGVARVDDPADAVRVGVQLRLEGLVLLVLALRARTHTHTRTHTRTHTDGKTGGGHSRCNEKALLLSISS